MYNLLSTKKKIKEQLNASLISVLGVKEVYEKSSCKTQLYPCIGVSEAGAINVTRNSVSSPLEAAIWHNDFDEESLSGVISAIINGMRNSVGYSQNFKITHGEVENDCGKKVKQILIQFIYTYDCE